jgi:hypothetical protein
MTDIAREHPDRLRAIVADLFSFLPESGFVETASRYDKSYLDGQLTLSRADAQFYLTIHNDVLDVLIGPAHPGDSKSPLKVSDIAVFLHPKPVDYAAFEATRIMAPVVLEPDAVWRAQARSLNDNLPALLAFVHLEGLAERRVALKTFFTERSAEFLRQRAEYFATRA